VAPIAKAAEPGLEHFTQTLAPITAYCDVATDQRMARRCDGRD